MRNPGLSDLIIVCGDSAQHFHSSSTRQSVCDLPKKRVRISRVCHPSLPAGPPWMEATWALKCLDFQDTIERFPQVKSRAPSPGPWKRTWRDRHVSSYISFHLRKHITHMMSFMTSFWNTGFSSYILGILVWAPQFIVCLSMLFDIRHVRLLINNFVYQILQHLNGRTRYRPVCARTCVVNCIQILSRQYSSTTPYIVF